VEGEEGCTCGRQPQKGRSRMCRADHTKVFVQFFRTCTQVLVETVAYVRKLQWRQSCMYAGLNVYSDVRAGMYNKIFYAGVGMYRLTSAVVWLTLASCTCGLQQICKLGFVPRILLTCFC
jgi:hypothetical protein